LSYVPQKMPTIDTIADKPHIHNSKLL